MNTNRIEEFICQSEENLRIAEAVTCALPQVMNRIGNAFVKRLGQRLSEKLTGWKIVETNKYYVDSWADMRISKPTWVDQYSVTLGFGEYGKWMVYGVMRDRITLRGRPFCGALLEVGRQISSVAVSHEDWECRIPIEDPSRSWQKSEILWRMQTDIAFMQNVADQLSEVAGIAEPIIDGLITRS